LNSRHVTDDPASMLPSSLDTVEVDCGRRRPTDGDRQRGACVDNVAPDDGSDNVQRDSRRRTTAQNDRLDDEERVGVAISDVA